MLSLIFLHLFVSRSGPFNVAVRELLGQYMALEEFYMNETCMMAIRIDEVSAVSDKALSVQ